MPLSTLTLTRARDGQNFRLEAAGHKYGCLAYRGDVQPGWIQWHPRWGWCATDGEEQILGLPLSTPKADQRHRPPEGDWISRGGPAPEVYALRWGSGQAA